MTFQKGHKTRLGIKHTEESRKKISLSRNGKSSGMKGKKHSEETKRKIREKRKLQTFSIETRKKLSNSKKKEKNILWKGGVTPQNILIRTSFEYRLWREAVFKRDNYTCIWCNKHGGELNADHIQLFSEYPELRFAIDNGRTLCKSCHKKRHMNIHYEDLYKTI